MNLARREIKPEKRQVMHNAIAQAAIWPAPPSSYTGTWPGISLWLSCCAPSQLLVLLLAGRAWRAEKS